MSNDATRVSLNVSQRQQQQQHDRKIRQQRRSSHNNNSKVAPLAVFLASCGSVTAFSSSPVHHSKIPAPTLLLRPSMTRRIVPHTNNNKNHNHSIFPLHGVSPKTQLANLMKKDQLPSEAEVPGPIGNRYYSAGTSSSTSAGTVDSTRARWIGWMRAGTPRGADEVKMREASELGGVPRSDRYSSRYVDKY